MDFIAPHSVDVTLNGLSEAQEEVCQAALQAFRERHGLAEWGLNMSLSDEGPGTWKLHISVVASRDLDFQVRSNHIIVDKTLDLARVVDLCLETHYHACMNSRAMSQRSNLSKSPQSQRTLNSRAAKAR